jgi:hypothetical protein
MSDAQETKQSSFPPVLIMIACALLVAGLLITIIALSSAELSGSATDEYDAPLGPINWIFLLLALVGCVGYWKMRRWGVYAYTAMVVLSTAYDVMIEVPFGIAYLTPVAICAIGWLYFGRMK